MPSEIEIKRFLEEKVMPFMNTELAVMLDRISKLEHEVALLKEGLDDKATLEIDESGRASLKKKK